MKYVHVAKEKYILGRAWPALLSFTLCCPLLLLREQLNFLHPPFFIPGDIKVVTRSTFLSHRKARTVGVALSSLGGRLSGGPRMFRPAGLLNVSSYSPFGLDAAV